MGVRTLPPVSGSAVSVPNPVSFHCLNIRCSLALVSGLFIHEGVVCTSTGKCAASPDMSMWWYTISAFGSADRASRASSLLGASTQMSMSPGILQSGLG